MSHLSAWIAILSARRYYNSIFHKILFLVKIILKILENIIIFKKQIFIIFGNILFLKKFDFTQRNIFLERNQDFYSANFYHKYDFCKLITCFYQYQMFHQKQDFLQKIAFFEKSLKLSILQFHSCRNTGNTFFVKISI